METIDERPRAPWGKFLTLLLALGVMAAVLGTLLWIVLSQVGAETVASEAEKARLRWMIRFAWICTALLGLTLTVMFWMIVRFIGGRFQPPPERARTEHVDAWRLAGRRIQVEDELKPDEDIPPQDPDEPAG